MNLPKSDVRPDRVERALGRLGFPGFVHLTAREPLTNPAAVVLRAVTKVDAFRRDLTDAERKYLTANRPDEAAYWNLLTRLRVEDLRYAE